MLQLQGMAPTIHSLVTRVIFAKHLDPLFLISDTDCLITLSMPSHQHSPNYDNYCFLLLWCIYAYDFNCHTKILILHSFLSLKKNP